MAGSLNRCTSSIRHVAMTHETTVVLPMALQWFVMGA